MKHHHIFLLFTWLLVGQSVAQHFEFGSRLRQEKSAKIDSSTRRTESRVRNDRPVRRHRVPNVIVGKPVQVEAARNDSSTVTTTTASTPTLTDSILGLSGLPPQLINTLTPAGQSMDEIEAELKAMLFGANGTQSQEKKQPVVDGDRGPEYEDYDYNDHDVYNPQNIKPKTTDSDNSTMDTDESQLYPLRHLYGPGPLRRRRPSGTRFGPHLPISRGRLSPAGRIRPYIPIRTKDSNRNERISLEETFNALEDDDFFSPNEEDDFFPKEPFSLRTPYSNPESFAKAIKTESVMQIVDPVDSGDCDFYTDNLCLNVHQYPTNDILSVLSRNQRVGQDLVADVIDQSADNLIDGVSSAQESTYTVSHYYGEGNRRQDQSHRDFAQDGGFLCPSEIMYAKPKRGKTAQGEWKDIVNVKDYTQTLRMEKCLKPGGSCSYVSHHYKSQCSQVYNYHRLLSWTKDRGLHMDIFKVPTCCSCHIMGYSYVYPPLRQGSKSRPIPSTTNTFKPSQSLDDGFVEGQQGFRPPFQHSPQFEDVGEEPEFFREPPPPPPSPPRRPVRPQAPLRDEFDPSVVFQEVVNGFGEESGDEFSSNDLEYVDIDGPSGSNDDFDEFMQSLTNQFPDSGDFGIQETAQPSTGHAKTVPAPSPARERVLNKRRHPPLKGSGQAPPPRGPGSPLLHRIRSKLSGIVRRPRRPAVPRRRMDTGESPKLKADPRYSSGQLPSAPGPRLQGPAPSFTAVQTPNLTPDRSKPKEEEVPLAEIITDVKAVQPSKTQGTPTSETDITTNPAAKEEGDDTKKVNYAYHPIIDFFDRYRWSAAASRR